MSNILPPEAGKKLARESRARLIITGAAILLVGALCTSLALVPAFIPILSARAELKDPNDIALSGARDDQAKQFRTMALIAALKPIVATSSPSDIVLKALAAKPAGVAIAAIQYSSGTIVLTGSSAKRDALNSYRESLQGSGLFSSVAVPVSAIVGTQEGRFTMTLKGNF